MPLARRILLSLDAACVSLAVFAAVFAAVPARADPAAPTGGSPVREATALQPGDVTAPLASTGDTSIDPGATFRVVLAGACQDGRLLLLDASGAAVPSDETREVGTTTALTLTPQAPLVPAGRYQLRLDGVSGREVHVAGQAYSPARWDLRVAGDPPPPAKATPKKKKHRR